MGAIRDLWDLLAPTGPSRVTNWGEAISDAVDAGTEVPEPEGASEGDLFIMRVTASGFEWVEVVEDDT